MKNIYKQGDISLKTFNMNQQTSTRNEISDDGIQMFFRIWLFASAVIAFAAIFSSLAIQQVVMIYTVVGILISFASIFITSSLWHGIKELSPPRAAIRIFWTALLLRLIAVPLLAWVFTVHTGVPFESGPFKDDYVYNETSIDVAQLWLAGEWDLPYYLHFVRGHYSGYPLFIAFLMYLTYPSFWVARITNALLGAGVAVLLYKVSLRCFNQRNITSLVGSLAIASPLLIYYSATNYKDMLLCFLGLLTIRGLMDLLIKGYLSLKNFVVVLPSMFLLLFIRTAYPITILLAFLLTILTLLKMNIAVKNKFKKTKLLPVVLLFAILITSYLFIWRLGSQYMHISNIDAYIETRMAGARSFTERSMVSKSSFVKYLGTPLYAMGSVFVPLPTLVDLPLDTVGDALFRPAYYVVGNILTNMSLSSLFILGLMAFYSKRRQLWIIQLPFWIFILYKMVLANSHMILGDRFNIPAILMSYIIIPLSVSSLSKGRRNLFLLFLLIQIIAMFLFNYVRVQSRMM